MATFNVLEAAVRWGVPRSRERLERDRAGVASPSARFPRPYAPIDEELPSLPQDPYALAKHFGEQLMDAAVAPVGHPLHLDPAVVGAVGGQLRAQPRPATVRDPDEPSASFWTYIDVYDLADALRLAAESDLPATRSSTSPRPTTAPAGRWRS